MEWIRDDGDVALRPWRLDDVDAVWRARRGDRECARWLVDAAFPFARTDAEALVADAVSQGPGGGFAAVRARDGEFIGAALLLTFGAMPEIGYWIAPAHRRQGLGLRVARLLFEHVAEERPEAVALITHPANAASRRIAARLGFVPSGTVPYGPWADGESRGLLHLRRVAMPDRDPPFAQRDIRGGGGGTQLNRLG